MTANNNPPAVPSELNPEQRERVRPCEDPREKAAKLRLEQLEERVTPWFRS